MTDLTSSVPLSAESQKHRNCLFVACFVALVATAFAFVIRSFILDDLRIVFNLSETQKGEINGAGFWPFAISIVVFSLIIDRIGYGKAMIFAFICHVGSVCLMFLANGYWSLYFRSKGGYKAIKFTAEAPPPASTPRHAHRGRKGRRRNTVGII